MNSSKPQPGESENGRASEVAPTSNVVGAPDRRSTAGLLVRVSEVAEMLNVSPRSVWRLIGLGHFEKVYVGGAVRIKRSAVEAFVERGGAR